jgi:type I restriction enzyme, S subunit
MLDLIKPYPDYKPSGQEWLGCIPAHWKQLRAKCLFREVDERSATGKEELLSVSHLTGVTPRSQKTITMFLGKSNVGHKLCQPDDVVINTMWAWMGALGVARHTGLVSPSYGVYRPLKLSNMMPRYTDNLLRTQIYAAEYQRRSTGVNSSRLRLYPEQFLRIPILVPPLDEQAAIVRVLDQIHAQVERAIFGKRKLMSLVAEERDALTNQVLSSPNIRHHRLGVVADRISRPICRKDAEIYTPIGLYNWGRGIFHKQPTAGAELGDSTFSRIEQGDLVLSGQFAWEGAIAIAGFDDAGCVASHRYPILRGKANLAETEFLLAFLRTTFGSVLMNHHSRGAAGRNRPLNISTLLKEQIPVPPLIEQKRLVELVNLEMRLAATIARTSQLLREYRSKIISDVVTGKVDVRGVNQVVPVTQEEIPVLDDDDSVEAEDAA